MYKNSVPIILASGSPRRQEFLKEIGLSFEVVVAEIDENPIEKESAEQFVARMAEEKAEYVAKQFPDTVIISGDTIVSLDDNILGKPQSKEHGVEMLMLLSGKRHVVRTGFCVMVKNRKLKMTKCVATIVQFTSFSERVARAYVETGEPMDKAGAYGIQGIGGGLVESIEGSYSNVVGLPVAELVAVLCKENLLSLV